MTGETEAATGFTVAARTLTPPVHLSEGARAILMKQPTPLALPHCDSANANPKLFHRSEEIQGEARLRGRALAAWP
jgi:hypothetical protein